jgi:hypothetical protein
LKVLLVNSLPNPHGTANLRTDTLNALSAWAAGALHDPLFTECPACTETTAPVVVKLVDESQVCDIDLKCSYYAVTVDDGTFDCTQGPPDPSIKCGSTLALRLHRTIKIAMQTNKDFSDKCAADGCAEGTVDFRLLISHEVGHVYGLGECDMPFGAICHTTANVTKGTDTGGGKAYWTPQTFDKQGLLVAYP